MPQPGCGGGGCTRGVLCWWHNRLLGTYEAGKLRDPALVEACEEYLRGWLGRHGATMEPSA